MKKNFPIKGFIPVTLLDWPGKVASMVFVGGCNFRCPFCYNVDLVLHPEKSPTILEKDIFNHLLKKKKWIDGLVIGGGEPTLYPKGLVDFCRKVKKLGFKIQIQTNGTNPEILKKLIKKRLVDYLALDIKGPLEKYEKIVRAKVDKKKLQKSIDLIFNNPQVESEFRTTIVPGLIDKEGIEEIGKWLSSMLKPQTPKLTYYLQQFRNENTLDPEFQKIKPYQKEELEEMLKIAQKYFKRVELRGA